MSQPEAGTSRKGLFSRDDYLAPPHIPTGQPPRDVLNTIWRKNEVFLDIGSYSIGSFVMVMWPPLLLCLWLMPPLKELDVAYWYIIFCLVIFPILMLLYLLVQPVPPPVRFNRQRREVCVPQKDGSYWIVPWEQVTAAATAVSSVGQHGKTTQGMLVVGFINPDPNAKESDRHFTLGFSCGGGTTAMRLWECMRSYMEIGPQAVPHLNDLDNLHENLGGKGPFWGAWWTYYVGIRDHLKAGEYGKALWLCFTIFAFGGPLILMLQHWKLAPPPDFTDPAIIVWSQPLPPEQWAKRSPELEQAIIQREAELASERTAA
ncbi:hypothetical protein CXK94_02755 [Stutzerimonas stutzeri]|uniref:DUF6708 domain-containing protein n=1 Tax=Stutzerimonas stutzeri TaxID=316 RepID=A0A2N8T9Z3_STUST|nr:DUF6708 domain-containing protein [Stutzerimonas stutzeri]PNG11516.1 hypothetical protein CXK94_02755 [Stutzerimonas stutzeri]